MQVNRPLYPYPVLSDFTNDYNKSLFLVHAKTELSGKDLIISLRTKIINKEIANLIEEKKVAVVYHFQCPSAGFRKAEKTFESEFKLLINRQDVIGALSVRSYLVTNEQITNYNNEDFHLDLQGFSFDFERGTIIGIANHFTINIEKNDLDILNRESIFSIVRNSDKTQNEMLTDLTENKIIIKVRNEDYDNLTSINKISVLQDTINSIFVLPVLVDVLHKILKFPKEERDSWFGIFAWYRVIRRSLRDHFNIDIENNDIESENILSLSQKLIEVPISDSLLFLSREYGRIESEDI